MPELKKALVIGVGAEKGLGASISARFAREGFHVFVAGRTAQSLEQVVQQIRSAGGTATAVVADATREAEVQALFDQVGAADGSLDVAVYNAGNNTPGAVTEMDADGIVTLALVSHFWPLPEPAKSLEVLQRHEAKRSEFGGELCQRDNALEGECNADAANGYRPSLHGICRAISCHRGRARDSARRR